ncbi:MAG TPA: SIS domain-containing protein, partial [Thermoleophilaceae bacterium]|nr:SIS domain-containing protein [Thermoleophilaceae bacterium]
RRLDRDEVTASIELISRADRIVLCGTDQMAFFASYLRHLLMLLDLRCEVVASPSQEGLAKLGRIDERTVLVGFSAGRPHPLVVRALKLARNRRAATVAVADATLSEVAKLADHKLFYSSNSPAYVRSHSALLAVVQALAYGVYALDESAYADRIKAFRLK